MNDWLECLVRSTWMKPKSFKENKLIKWKLQTRNSQQLTKFHGNRYTHYTKILLVMNGCVRLHKLSSKCLKKIYIFIYLFIMIISFYYLYFIFFLFSIEQDRVIRCRRSCGCGEQTAPRNDERANCHEPNSRAPPLDPREP